jgi:glucan biosynthesis protein
MMDTSEEIPDSIEANWVPGQKGTPLLRDNNNFNYRIHMKNKAGTKANYR